MEHLSISTPTGLRKVRTSIVDMIKSKGINITTEFKLFYQDKFEEYSTQRSQYLSSYLTEMSEKYYFNFDSLSPLSISDRIVSEWIKKCRQEKLDLLLTEPSDERD